MKKTKLAKQGGVGAAEEKQAGREDLLNMDQAIAQLKTTRPTFYRWLRSGKLRGMKVGRQWRFYRADVERFMKGEAPRIDLPVDVNPLVHALQARIKELGGRETAEDQDSPVARAVSLMIQAGVLMKASDLHLTTNMETDPSENTGVLRCRVDGLLQVTASFDCRLMPALVERWKIMCNCNLHEKDKPQDGRIMLRTEGKTVDLRVSFLPSVTGETMTARVLDHSKVGLDLDQIPYAPRDREKIDRALKAPFGMVIVTGPMGCGKTTVLYSCLSRLARPELKVVTVENPVELTLPWATQIAVKPETGMTYPVILRAVMRAAPNVVMIGEIRDAETLRMAQQLALTGHRVLTVMHTSDAVGALQRMRDIGSESFIIAESTKLIVAQRLIRKLCPACRVAEAPTPEQMDMVSRLAQPCRLDWPALGREFRKSVGCSKCNGTGYRGRSVMAEVLEVTPEIGKILCEKASPDAIRNLAVEQGMTTLAADGLRRAAQGETSLAEVIRILA